MSNQEEKKSQALKENNMQIIPDTNPYQHYFSKRVNKQNEISQAGRNLSTNQINNRKMMPSVESANKTNSLAITNSLNRVSSQGPASNHLQPLTTSKKEPAEQRKKKTFKYTLNHQKKLFGKNEENLQLAHNLYVHPSGLAASKEGLSSNGSRKGSTVKPSPKSAGGLGKIKMEKRENSNGQVKGGKQGNPATMLEVRNQSQSETDLNANTKVQKNLSSMSTNPSTAQVNMRNPKQQAAVSLKQALQNQGKQTTLQQQQKQLLVLNQRYIQNTQQAAASKKIPIVSSRAPGYEEEITLGISRIPTHNFKESQLNAQRQTLKLEGKSAKGNQAAHNGGVMGTSGSTLQQPKFHNSYQTKFGKIESRNSQLSALSVGVASNYSNNRRSSQNHTVQNAYPVTQKSMSTSQYSKQSNSFQPSGKGSYSANKSQHGTSYNQNFPPQGSISAQDLKVKNQPNSIEIRGVGTTGKFVQSKVAKGSQSNQILSKTKAKAKDQNSKFLNKKINVIKGNNYHGQTTDQQSSARDSIPNSRGVQPQSSEIDQKDKSKIGIPMQGDGKDLQTRSCYSNASKKQTVEVQNQHLKKMLAVQQSKTGMTKNQQQNTNCKFNKSDLVVDLNSTRKQTKSDRKELNLASKLEKYLPMTLAENTLERVIGNEDIENNKSEKSGINYFHNQGKIMKIHMKSEQQKTRQTRMTAEPHSAASVSPLIRGPKPSHLKSEKGTINELPQIMIQQNKSEGNFNGIRDHRLMSKDSAPHIRAIKKGEKEYQNGFNVKRKHQTESKNSHVNVGEDESQINVFESINDTHNIHHFQQIHNHNNKSFDHIRDAEVMSANTGARPPNLQDRSFESQSKLNRAGTHSYTSLDKMQRPDTQNKSVNRKARLRELNNNSIGITEQHDPQNESIQSIKRNRNAVQLAPLYNGGSRDQFGQAPGTANTHGGPSRQIYKSNNGTMNMQYKIPSQQCQSEVYQVNSKHQGKYINENTNAYQNPLQAANNVFQSNFDESFEKLFAPQNFDNLGALDPRDDMDDLPSISNIPVIRNQKSQATQRQTPDMPNQKLSINQYNNNPMHLNYSQSEIYDNQSTSNIHEINSQLNEIQIQAAVSQVSQGSNDSGNRDLPGRNESYLSKREGTANEDGHPFNGPKLHLFRKGQSKSSQLKSRKVKTSEQHQRLLELNSMQHKGNVKLNPVYSQHSGMMAQPHYQPQFSEGASHQSALLKKPSKSKNGHINISEILGLQNGNFQSGLIAGAGNNLGSIERMYTDNRSLDSQGVISHQSLEYLQQKEHHQLLDNESSSLQYRHQQNGQQPQLNALSKGADAAPHDLMAGIETRSQQCPSQFSTLQQNNIADESQDSRENLNVHQYNINGSQSVLLNDQSMASPYIANYNRSLGGKGVSKHVMQKIQEQQKQAMRPNTTNPGNPIFIDNNSMEQTSNFAAQYQLQNSQIQQMSGTPTVNFQHPKVGKNSKHPQVFKNHSNSQKAMLKQYQNKNISRQIISKNKLEPFENAKNNMLFGNAKASDEKTENNAHLQPDQTGDFPSPREIRTYTADGSEDNEGQNCQNVENAYKENAVINAGLQSLNSDREQEKFVSLLTVQQKEESVYAAAGYEDTKNNKNLGGERHFKSRQGGQRPKMAKPEEATTNITTAEVTVENEHPYSSYRSQGEHDGQQVETPNLPGIQTPPSGVGEPFSPQFSNDKIIVVKERSTPQHKDSAKSNESITVDHVDNKEPKAGDKPSDHQKGVDQSESLDPSHGRSGSMGQQNLLNACSIAQTPCFAETPNTTDQFKNYKINDKGEISSSMPDVHQIILNNVEELQEEAAKNPQYSP